MTPEQEWDGDRPLPEDDAIKAAHPMLTGRHDLYAEAMRLVGARQSKGALVELVNWLLTERDAVKAELATQVRLRQLAELERDQARRGWKETVALLSAQPPQPADEPTTSDEQCECKKILLPQACGSPTGDGKHVCSRWRGHKEQDHRCRMGIAVWWDLSVADEPRKR